MTRTAYTVFVAFACAAVAGLLLSQHWRNTPAPIAQLHRTAIFSLAGSKWPHHARIAFKLKRSDTVSVAIVDERGAVVRRLASGVSAPGWRRQRFVWNGHTDAGRAAACGKYRLRIHMRKQARTVTTPQTIHLTDCGEGGARRG